MVSWKRKPEAQRKGIGFSPVPPAEGECLVLIAGVRPIYWTLHQVVRATHRLLIHSLATYKNTRPSRSCSTYFGLLIHNPEPIFAAVIESS